jgi:nitric oxide reductase subunit C
MAKVWLLGFAIALFLLTGLVASGGTLNGPQAERGDIARGRAIFEQASIHGTPGCITCHSPEPGVTVVGPSLAGIGTRALALLQSPDYNGLATTPEQFLREAVLTRQCDLWGGSRHLIIPEWEGVFERQELIDLTAFLASLK